MKPKEAMMGRPVILGNGALTVGLNEHGFVHDFYYPYVGLDNLTTARSVHHKIGIWVDGIFGWVDDGSWTTTINIEHDALISNIIMENENIHVRLEFIDFVDSEVNALCRSIKVINNHISKREIRVFLHQVFEISRAGRGDTALYVPEDNYILDYKGRCSLIIYGETSNMPFDQYAIGNYGIEGKEGTFRDAEDGELSGSPVEHGGVDSVIRFKLDIDSNESKNIDYWIAAADSEHNALIIHDKIKEKGLSYRLQSTKNYWNNWLLKSKPHLDKIDKNYRIMAQKSLMLIKVHCDERGGIIASCDSSIYNYGRDYYSYVWPRDGAYALWPLIRMGYDDEAKKFFGFCRDILDDKGFLAHKFQPDKAIGSTWHPLLHDNHKEYAIQEDETAIVIYMLGEYLRYSGDHNFVQSLYLTFVQPATNFLAKFIDDATGLPHASYDLWEEKFLTTTYSTAVTYQALLVASEFAERFEYPDDAVYWNKVAAKILNNSEVFVNPQKNILRKGFLLMPDGSLKYDNTLDVSSIYGVMVFGLDNTNYESLYSSITEIESTILDKSPSGGCPRYEGDEYFKSDPAYFGNPWFVSTLWLAQYYIRIKKFENAHKYLEWTLDHSMQSGALSEQINPTNGKILSVSPLIWSHAEYLNTILDLYPITSE